jgi:hypothetical protein
MNQKKNRSNGLTPGGERKRMGQREIARENVRNPDKKPREIEVKRANGRKLGEQTEEKRLMRDDERTRCENGK